MHNSLSDESQIEVGEGHWIIGGQGGGIAWTRYVPFFISTEFLKLGILFYYIFSKGHPPTRPVPPS